MYFTSDLCFRPTKNPSLSVANTTLALRNTVERRRWKRADNDLGGVVGVKLLAQIAPSICRCVELGDFGGGAVV